MLCCVGLFGGLAVGQSLGGPWTYIAPAAGFGVGLVADMTVMKRMHGKSQTRPAPAGPDREVQPPRSIPAEEDQPRFPLPDLGKV